MRIQSPIESVDRALRVVEYLAQIGPVGVALAELSQAVDLNKATAHRILAALRFRDYVTQTPAGDYVLGPAATEIRSEERRVGKEWRDGRAPERAKSEDGKQG